VPQQVQGGVGGEGHGERAEQEVAERQVDDEVVARDAHAAVVQHGRHDHQVAQRADHADQRVAGQHQRPHKGRLLAERVAERPQRLLNVHVGAHERRRHQRRLVPPRRLRGAVPAGHCLDE